MYKQSLPTAWTARAVSNFDEVPATVGQNTLAATVPGCIHLDLIQAGLIEDPYLDRNEEKVQWIGRTDWEFSTTFQVDGVLLEEDCVDLVCEGLDTIATLWINEVEVGRSENMHVELRLAIKEQLKAGENSIRIRFDSAAHYARAMRDRLGNLPTTYPDHEPYNFIRKNACNFGWDWGPVLITCGIWKAIRLEAWSVVRLANVRPLVRVANERVAVLEVSGELVHSGVSPRSSMYTLYDGMGGGDQAEGVTHFLGATLSLQGERITNASLDFNPSDTTFSLTLTVPQPQLWWPVGYGEQPLYKLHLSIPSLGLGLEEDLMPGAEWAHEGDHDHDHEHDHEHDHDEDCGCGHDHHHGEIEDSYDSYFANIGLREVELDTTPDDAGAAWTLKVNGQKIWCKGANWIPDDVFLPRGNHPERLEERLAQALDANMNMMRIWGGGIYETDQFYDLCDSMGLLVWQDFLFACAAYSEEEPMRSLVEAEVRHNVIRLSSHPSLVLWNGCNENIWGYFDWGWQKEVAGRTWGAGYYFQILPELLSELDTSRPYWPGSPYSGTMDMHPLADGFGNKHIWDCWNEVDYTHFRRYVPRFASEFGHQAPPTFSTLARSIPEDARDPFSPSMLAHQKANDGNDKLHNRLKEHFEMPADFDDWIYLTQLNQARAMTTAVEWFRSRPLCTGALYWQINDCWPVTSWAAIDGDGRPKPLYFATQSFFRDRLLTIQPDGDSLALWAHNDTDEVWADTCQVALINFAGEAEDSAELPFLVPPRGLQKVARLEEFVSEDKSNQFLAARTEDEEAFWYFAPDKDLTYPEPKFDATFDGETLTIEAKTFIRDLCIFADRLDAQVDCGLITLLPGDSAEFVITSDKPLTAKQLTSRPVLNCANLHGKPRR